MKGKACKDCGKEGMRLSVQGLCYDCTLRELREWYKKVKHILLLGK